MSFNDRNTMQQVSTNENMRLRGVVVNREDPIMEGRVAVIIPRLMHEGDPGGIKHTKKKTNINTDFLENEELGELVSKDIETSNAMWARPVGGHSGKNKIPYKGATIYVYMEDGDPSKLYYSDEHPTIQGSNPEMYNVQATEDVYTPDKRPNIHLLEEFSDKTTVYYNENNATKEFRIHLTKGSYITIFENETSTKVELKTSGGHIVSLDDTNKRISLTTTTNHSVTLDDANKQISAKSAGGHSIVLDDAGKAVNISSTGGHSFVMNDGGGIVTKTTGGSSLTMSQSGTDMIMQTSSGATVVMNGGGINASAGGSSISLGGGKININ